jgi:hypothetical protein
MGKRLTQEQLEVLQASGLAGDTDQTDGERDLAQAESDAEQDIFAALLELDAASDARWQVHRLLPVENAGFVREFNSAELTLSNLAAVCGPGKYKVKGLNGKGRYIGQRSITIAKPADVPVATRAESANSSVADMLAIMREERENSNDRLMKWAAILVPAITPILPAMFGGRKETSLGELTTALANMKALAGNDKDSLSKVQEVTALIAAIKDMSGDSESKTGSTVVDLVRDGVKEIGPMLSAFIASRNRGPVPSPQPPRFIAPNPQAGNIPTPETTPAQPAAATPVEDDPMMKLFNWLQSQLELMVLKAAKNSNPELCAEWLADSVPAGVTSEQIKGILISDNWWAQMSTFYPPVAPYEGWFTELRGELLHLIEEAEKSAGESGANE